MRRPNEADLFGGTQAEDRTIARLALRMHRTIGGQLGHDLFSAPAWEMLLDLYLRDDDRPISLTSLSGATSAAPRTALHTINRMVNRGPLVRSPDPDDGRRIHVCLSETALTLLDQSMADMRDLLRQPARL